MTNFVCPACKAPLTDSGASLRCPGGHSYDRARQGYVHLLPPNKMHAKIPGDNKMMVDARRRFLEKGYYALFKDSLRGIVSGYIKNSQTSVILDAGCGEGYYTAGIKAALPMACVSAFDISKFAVKAAAGKYKNIDFAVASIFDIPFAHESADCVVNVFAPIVEAQFLRVLKKGGYLVLAVPGRRHLYGLKEVLYSAPYENEEKDTPYEGFAFIRRVPVRDVVQIGNNQDLLDLFSMTPYYWKTGVEGGERLKKTAEITTEIHFDFLVYRKMT